MAYISNTDKERKEMLAAIGADSFDDLIANIPEKFHLRDLLNLDEPKSEMEISRKINDLAKRNQSTQEINSFLGAGIYEHFIPAAVDHVLLRPEFSTAYTPYQAEVSQGTLQAIYEYQTMICRLTGMEIANAGMYDGASAAAEAILMAVRKTKKHKAVIAGTIHPNYLDVIKSYVDGIEVNIVIAPAKDGQIDTEKLNELMDDDTACLLLQTPNFLGNLEEVFEIEKIVHSYKKALFIVAVDPISLALVNAPSEYKADIVVGEGQVLGNKMNFGGPLTGFFATTMKLARMMPGRIAGGTVDAEGKRAYALTLQAREQHIRREKATSNICSNEALCSLASLVYLCLMGPAGLSEVAKQSTKKAHYLAQGISLLNNYKLAYTKPFFKEFVIETPVAPSKIIDDLKKKNIFPGVDLTPHGYKNHLMIAVTEMKTKAQLDQLIAALAEVNNG